MNHFIEKCQVCGAIIHQCRCMSCDKEVILSVCGKCKQDKNEIYTLIESLQEENLKKLLKVVFDSLDESHISLILSTDDIKEMFEPSFHFDVDFYPRGEHEKKMHNRALVNIITKQEPDKIMVGIGALGYLESCSQFKVSTIAGGVDTLDGIEVYLEEYDSNVKENEIKLIKNGAHLKTIVLTGLD